MALPNQSYFALASVQKHVNECSKLSISGEKSLEKKLAQVGFEPEHSAWKALSLTNRPSGQ